MRWLAVTIALNDSFPSEWQVHSGHCVDKRVSSSALTLDLFKHLSRNTKALQRLRHAAINTNHMDNRADFILGDAVVDRATTMGLPFLHFDHSPDLR